MLSRILKALYFWTVGWMVTFSFAVLALAVHYLGKLLRLPSDGRREHRVAILWGRVMIGMMPGWRVTVEGAEHLPAGDKACVMVCNHESLADIFALYFLGIQFRWLAKEETFKVPLIGFAMRKVRYIPIRRGDKASHARALAESVETLQTGVSMCYFPEGTRSPDGTIKPFKVGAFKVASDCNVSILPIALRGASKLLPKGSLLPDTAHIRITVLPSMVGESGEDLEGFAERVRERIVSAHAALE